MLLGKVFQGRWKGEIQSMRVNTISISKNQVSVDLRSPASCEQTFTTRKMEVGKGAILGNSNRMCITIRKKSSSLSEVWILCFVCYRNFGFWLAAQLACCLRDRPTTTGLPQNLETVGLYEYDVDKSFRNDQTRTNQPNPLFFSFFGGVHVKKNDVDVIYSCFYWQVRGPVGTWIWACWLSCQLALGQLWALGFWDGING